MEEVILPLELEHVRHVYHLFVISVRERRSQLVEFLNAAGIQTGYHYPVPIHLQKGYTGLGYLAAEFPVTEEHAAQILSLPMFPELTEEQIVYVAEKISEFYHR